VQQLSAEKDDFNATIGTLKAELILAHEETERATRQLDAMRNQMLHESAHESLQRERELQETQFDLERCRIERDEWERSALQEQTISEELRSTLDELRRELQLLGAAKDKNALELEHEREKTANLQSVLQDFQTGAFSFAKCLCPRVLDDLQPRITRCMKRSKTSTLNYFTRHSLSPNINTVH
jgi:predicted RNase H-like nuclease (RuvC/YqgF family)